MNFEKDDIYHVYNRSNERLFYSRDNYIFFLNKIRRYILPYADVLAYCLMPNHFHIMIVVKEEGAQYLDMHHKRNTQYMSHQIGTLLSSYTQAINKERKRRGSLFAHNSKAKLLDYQQKDSDINLFMYIHRNPIKAGLVDKIEDWEYSSYPEYIGKREGSLVNIKLALEILSLDPKDIETLTNMDL